MRHGPATIDDYLALLPLAQRRALTHLRRAIHAAAKDLEECISYQLPAFRHRGRMLVWFGAATKHCAFYPGAFPIVALAKELAGYDTSKGTVRFDAATPLPVRLVKQLVKARIDEQAALPDRTRSKPRTTKPKRGRRAPR